jgi:hypothetical protein
MPTAMPPGTTLARAVDAWVTASAERKPRPGSATIQGGAKVTMFRIVAPISARIHGQDSVVMTSQTSA